MHVSPAVKHAFLKNTYKSITYIKFPFYFSKGLPPLPRFAWHTRLSLRSSNASAKPRKAFFRCAMPKGALPLWKPRTRRREARVLGQAVAALPSSPTPEPEAGVIPQASRGFRGISSAQKDAPAVFHDPLTPAPFPKPSGELSRAKAQAAAKRAKRV